MKVAIRADASTLLGSGHIMRCLTLAKMLSQSGAEVSFVCLELPGSMLKYIQAEGFDVYKIEPKPEMNVSTQVELLEVLRANEAYDLSHTLRVLNGRCKWNWVIVDHYALGEHWEQGIREAVSNIFVIDDLADRRHECDILLDQNFHYDMATRYIGLVPSGCRLLLGPEWLLLREEFHQVVPNLERREGRLSRLLLFFGGSDSTNETRKALHAIRKLAHEGLHTDVVVGGSNPHKEEIRALCHATIGAVFHCQIDYMAKLMNEADLAIGAGGSTTWERCYLGLPALIVVLAENQRAAIEELEPAGAYVNLGDYQAVDETMIHTWLERLLNEPEHLRNMSRNASELVPSVKVEKADAWLKLLREEKSE